MNARDRRLQRRAREQQRHNGPQPSPLVYITRSFSRKLNLGNYESEDLFCSLNLQCFAEDAADKSQAAVEWCRNQVQGDIKRFRGLDVGQSVETEKHPTAKSNAAAFEAKQRADQAKVAPGKPGAKDRTAPTVPIVGQDASLPIKDCDTPPWKSGFTPVVMTPLQRKLQAAEDLDAPWGADQESRR